MNCYCYETETEFVFCVEDADEKLEGNLNDAWFKKTDKGFLKIYNKDMESNGVGEEDKELVKRNFARLGQSMFEGVFDWRNVLLSIAQKFTDGGIEWYIIGSAGDAVLGVNIEPRDIDIIVHTRDFFKARSIFTDYIVEPFVDNKGTWLVQYFGRLCLGGAIVDIAADEGMNAENRRYEEVSWNGYDVLIEPLSIRYRTEIKRKREDRIKAIEEYMKHF